MNVDSLQVLDNWTLYVCFGLLQFVYSITSAMNDLLGLTKYFAEIKSLQKYVSIICSDLCEFMS